MQSIALLQAPPGIALPGIPAYYAPMSTIASEARADAPALRVVVSLDVEEEGLFSGRYAASDCGVRNVALLPRLAPLSRELGFPLTLFCAHTVFASAEARPVLAWMRDHCGAEIGAHLHHWSTPPLVETGPEPGLPPIRPTVRPRAPTACRATCCAGGCAPCWTPGGTSSPRP